jgi:hypothetical protein
VSQSIEGFSESAPLAHFSAWTERVERVEEEAGLLGLWRTGLTGVQWLQRINVALAEKRIAATKSAPMRTR